ncbi:hypothetical protein E8E11_003267 [Didymella keratinophila]|nr:hypothetical protein E8E11_003267 [Didymella keratinophila]
MPPRRRAKPKSDNDAKGPPKQEAKYVSLFGSPRAPTAAPVNRNSTPPDQSDSNSPSEWSSSEPRKKIARPTAVTSTPTTPTRQHPATQHPTTQHPNIQHLTPQDLMKRRWATGQLPSPQGVARAFEFESYQRLSAASPIAATPTTQTQSPGRLPRYTDSLTAEARMEQTQSRLPPSTDARKAPRKATIPAPALPGPSEVTKPHPQPGETKRPQRTGSNLLTPLSPLKISQKIQDEALLEAKAGDGYLLSTAMKIGSADDFVVAVAAAEARARGRKAAAMFAPTPSIQPVPRPQRPESLKELERPEEPEEPQKSEYKYDLTSELDGIKRALGDHDWKVEYSKIDRGEFAKQEKRIFQTPTFSGLYRVVREMVAQQLPARELGE